MLSNFLAYFLATFSFFGKESGKAYSFTEVIMYANTMWGLSCNRFRYKCDESKRGLRDASFWINRYQDAVYISNIM